MPQEFRKYRERGAYHWRLALPEGVLAARPQFLGRYQAALSLARRGFRVRRAGGVLLLDCGCGDGVLTFLALRAGLRVVGIDGDGTALQLARHLIQHRGYTSRLVRADVCSMPFPSSTYHVACAVEVIEHLADPRTFVSETARVLVPSGKLVCTTPNHEVTGDTGDPYHVHEFSPEELRGMLEERYESVVVRGLRTTPIQKRGSTKGRGRMACWIRSAFTYGRTMLFNPYARTYSDPTGSRCDTLIAVASNPRCGNRQPNATSLR